MIFQVTADTNNEGTAIVTVKADAPVRSGALRQLAKRLNELADDIPGQFPPLTPPPRAEEPKPAEIVNTLSRPADNG
jgi:hypothetical protein